ncbi:MAG: hypothetical protein ABR497_08470 [Kiritimatiellia bacterium]|nr:hypothetical protein [Lentisphaerota bacterium]
MFIDLVSKVYAKQVATTRNPPNINKTDYFFTGGLRVVATVRTFESNSIETGIKQLPFWLQAVVCGYLWRSFLW